MKQSYFRCSFQKSVLKCYGYLFCGIFMTLVSFSIFALPAVESRTGQPNVKNRPDHPPEFYGDNVYHGEPLIPVTAPSEPPRNHSVHRDPGASAAEERAAQLTLREIEALQKEVSELRGIIEVQDHEIKQLKKSQQDFYLDLDRRISQVQNNTKGTPAKTKQEAKDNKNKMPGAAAGIASGTLDSKKATDPIKPKSEKQTVTHDSNDSKQSETKSETKLGAKSEAKPETKFDAKSEANKTTTVSSAVVTQNLAPDSDLDTPPTATVATPAPNTKGQNDETLAYQSAYNFLKTKRYDEAVTAFQKYLTQFPQGEHVANARYWLGEVYMVKWQSDKTNTNMLDKAKQSFSDIANDHPNHTKTADAALKLGLIELDKGNHADAKEQFLKVKSRYPGTAAARVAENRLRQLP